MRAPRLLGITCGGEALTERVDVAIAAGIDVLVREPALNEAWIAWFSTFAHRRAGVSHPRNGAVIGRIVLHDRMPGARAMAVTLGLGLHLRGSDDPAREDVRAARGRHPFLLGASTHSPEEARAALRAGADYVLLSPIWPSPSKPDDARTPLGAEVFDALRGLPVLALGGLTPERLTLARAEGAWGGAAMGALFDAKGGAITLDHVRDAALAPWLEAANYSP